MEMGFGPMLKAARREKRKKLRELSEITGLSISFISDIENERKKVPSLEVVEKIEKFLRVPQGQLLKAAKKQMAMGTEFKSILKRRPALSLSLLRVTEGLTDEELSDLITKIEKGKGGGQVETGVDNTPLKQGKN